MCIVAIHKTKDFYFGRTLNYELSYGNEVIITPRNNKFDFRKEESIHIHYTMIGIAHIVEDYPL